MRISLDGQDIEAQEGDTVAAALLRARITTFTRSIKYHRPRGPFCLAGSCGQCLMRVDGVPSLPACRVPTADGMRCERQNAPLGVERDLFRAADFLFHEGLDHHHLLTGSRLLGRVALEIARRLAGLGELPDAVRPRLAGELRFAKLVIVGAGPAGLAAARASGAGTVVLEREARAGGAALLFGQPVDADVGAGELMLQTECAGLYANDTNLQGNALLAVRQRDRVLALLAERVIVATGGVSQPLTFPGVDRPGVYAARGLLGLSVMVGRKLAVVGEGEEQRRCAEALSGRGFGRDRGEGRVALSEKAIVCACEDVSVHEIDLAIAHGFADIESLKRYTGLGTGPCQGKSCEVSAMRICAQRKAVPPEAQVPFRARPPLQPTPIAAYAGLPDAVIGSRVSTPGLRPTWGKGAHPLQPRTPLPERADVVIGGGVRAQWTTPTLIELAKESIEFMGRFAQELGINVWLRKGGYLFLAHDDETVRRIEYGAELQKRHGLPTRVIGPEEAGGIVPQLDTSKFIAASWNPEDGVVFPWPFLWGYADGARKRGAQVETFTRCTGIEVSEGRVRAVETDRGRVAADRVVIAAGAWSPTVARLAGVALPNVPFRHEIVSSEPLKPFLGPLVSMLGTGLYFSQSMRGEIVGGMGDPEEPPGLNQASSLRFMTRYSRALGDLVPQLGAVKLLRQWAGCYDVTPDHSPVLV